MINLSAKWSSNEDVSSFGGRGGRGGGGGSNSSSGVDSPFLKDKDRRRDFKPINFDSNSLKRNQGKENVSGNSQVGGNIGVSVRLLVLCCRSLLTYC